jgi:hypothetical protein
MPEFENKCAELEYYCLKDFIIGRIPRVFDELFKSKTEEIYNLISEHFSNKCLSLFFYDTIDQFLLNNRYLHLNNSFISDTKKLARYFLLYLRKLTYIIIKKGKWWRKD